MKVGWACTGPHKADPVGIDAVPGSEGGLEVSLIGRRGNVEEGGNRVAAGRD